MKADRRKNLAESSKITQLLANAVRSSSTSRLPGTGKPVIHCSGTLLLIAYALEVT